MMRHMQRDISASVLATGAPALFGRTRAGSKDRGNLLPLPGVGKLTQLLLASFLMALATSGGAHAQSTMPDASAENPLAARQQIVRDRMVQLEDRMFRLTEKLAQADPQQARRLEEALQRSGKLLIRHHMDQAIELLEEANLAEAADHQVAVQKALEELLTLLTETAGDDRQRREDIERLQDMRQQVDRLLERQLDLRGKTDPSERLGERLAAAAGKLESILERQSAQLEQTRGLKRGDGSPEEADDIADRQAELREQTEALIDELQQDDTPDRPTPLMHAGREARLQMRDAADQMDAAESDLRQNLPITAEPKQQEAVESLQKALESLRQQQRKLQPANAEQAAGEQNELEREAGKLADAMGDQSPEPVPFEPDRPAGSQPESQDGQPQDQQNSGQPQNSDQPGADSQEGERQDNQQPPQAPSPGGDNVRKAQRHMKQAADRLEQAQPGDATRQQDQAIDELEQARAELEETLDQLRREQQEEMLAGLEQRFRAMLLRQQEINGQTASLDERKADWTRSDSLDLAGLAEKQTLLGGDAAEALHILSEEGSTVVFPEIVAQIRDDMNASAQRLAARQTGEITRGIQDEIVRALQELVEAIEKRQQEGPPPQQAAQPGQPGGENETPLLPSSAELKLLRSCQVRLHRSTQQLSGLEAVAADDIADEAQRLSDRQEQLARMARTIHERGQGP